MTTDVISPGEAWETVQRLRAWLIFNSRDGKWYVDVPGQVLHFGVGDEPLEAVANLLERIAATEFMQRPGIQSGLAKLEPLN